MRFGGVRDFANTCQHLFSPNLTFFLYNFESSIDFRSLFSGKKIEIRHKEIPQLKRCFSVSTQQKLPGFTGLLGIYDDKPSLGFGFGRWDGCSQNAARSGKIKS